MRAYTVEVYYPHPNVHLSFTVHADSPEAARAKANEVMHGLRIIGLFPKY